MTAGLQHHFDLPPLTIRIGASVAGLADADISAAVADTFRRGLVDYVGVLIAGSSERVVGRVRDALGFLGPDEARLLPGGVRCSARNAALINGIAGHVLDFDDVALDGHPSAVLVPALLAEAEAVGGTNADLLRGYVAGYETWAALWGASPEPLHSRGWHPSGVFGTVAAAAACAALRHLPERQAANALGLAAAQASGLLANFGTMAKSFQIGRAAEAGLLSARLAAWDVDASPEVFEHKSGFLRAFAGGSRPISGGFGKPDWAILTEGLDIKTYPVCYATLRLVDAALQLKRDEQLSIKEIAAIDLRLGRIQSEILHSQRPQTVLEAKFSCEFAVASALVFGAVGLVQLKEELVRQDDIQSLIGRTTRILDPEIGVAPFSPFDQVTLRLSDGRVVKSWPVTHASGSRHTPPGREEARAKFEDATRGHLSVDGIARLFDALWDLDPGKTVAGLLDETGLGASQ
jgi:2-methylcitrate dehydratase PrpD